MENGAWPLPTVSVDLDSPATLTVCRVCLTMNVRMYHISEHKLRVMYERVTGLEINSEDKLPQKLCWECVARLSSANCFINRALECQRILKNKMNDSRFITLRDIESIGKSKTQLGSTLGMKHYKVDHYNFYITESLVETDIVNECYNEIIGESLIINFNEDEKDTERYVPEGETDVDQEELNSKKNTINHETVQIKREQCIMTIEDVTDDNHVSIFMESDIGDVNHEIKSENVYVNNEEFEIINASNNDTKSHRKEKKKKNASNKESTQEENQKVDQMESNKVCVVIKQSPKPLRNRSDTLSRRKEPIVVLEDIMLSNYNTQDKGLTGSVSLTEGDENSYCSSIKDRIKLGEDDINILEKLTNSTDTIKALKYENTTTYNSYVSDPCNVSQTISTRTSNVISNNLIPNDTESLQKFFICDICTKHFYCKSNLILHIRKHTKVHSCTYCSYKTKKRENLNSHVNAKHTKSIVFKCSYCSYKAFKKYNVDQHVNAQHTKSTVFNCTYCRYKTYNKSDLNRHNITQHIKSIVFHCSYCSYKTHRKWNLDLHINSQHTKSTVFNCSDCSFQTLYRQSLSNHVKVKHS